MSLLHRVLRENDAKQSDDADDALVANSASAPKDAPMLTFFIIDDENFPAEEDEDEEEEEEGTMSLSDSPSSY